MFNFFKKQASSLFLTFSNQLSSLLQSKKSNQEILKQLERMLIQADFGSKTTHFIIQELEKKNLVLDEQTVVPILEKLLKQFIKEYIPDQKTIFLLVGINGCGKTTLAAKLAHQYNQYHKKTLFVPADTFRAAAQDQLAEWAEKLQVDILPAQAHKDPASVVFDGCKKFNSQGYDHLIIDTAGRLQTKDNLMHELTKLKRVITKQLPETSLCTLLVLDATLGQNLLEQARIFHEATHVDAIVLTKTDSLSKGGIVCAIGNELSLPIAYISFGEKKEALNSFNASEFIHDLLS